MSVFWFLANNETAASSRIHGINIHRELNKRGINSIIVQKPSIFSNDIVISHYFERLFRLLFTKKDVVIFQKIYGSRTLDLADYLLKKGVKVIFIDCDLPLKVEVAHSVSTVVCPSARLADLYKETGCENVVEIKDAVEFEKKPDLKDNKNRTIVWFGSGKAGKWKAVEWFKDQVLPHLDSCFKFITISDHELADIKWSLPNLLKQLSAADISVIPIIQSDENSVKSANRATQSLAFGVPVVCGDIQSYRNVINPKTGLISNDPEEWISFINSLKDQNKLNEIKAHSYDASKEYFIDKIADEWVDVVGDYHKRTILSSLFLLLNSLQGRLIKFLKK